MDEDTNVESLNINIEDLVSIHDGILALADLAGKQGEHALLGRLMAAVALCRAEIDRRISAALTSQD